MGSVDGMLMAVARKPRVPGRRPMSPMSSETRAGLGAAFMLIALVTVVELADGITAHYIGLLAAAPFLAASFASWRQVLVVGVVATVIGAIFAIPDAPNPKQTMANVVNIAFVVFGTGIAAVVGAIRQRQAEGHPAPSRPASAPPGARPGPLG